MQRPANFLPTLRFLLRLEKLLGTKKGSGFMFPEAVQGGAWPTGPRDSLAPTGL